MPEQVYLSVLWACHKEGGCVPPTIPQFVGAWPVSLDEAYPDEYERLHREAKDWYRGMVGDPIARFFTTQITVDRAEVPYTPGICRECGCTADRACWHMDFGGCGWAEPDLCTACTPDAGEGWEHPQDFGPREDEDGEGVKPTDPSDGAESQTQGCGQKTAPDAEVQEGAESSRVGGPSDSKAVST